MYIESYNNHGSDYLRLVEYVRTEDGKRGRKILLVLGAESELTDGNPDFLQRLHKSFKEGHPIIKELEPYVSGKSRVAYLPFPVAGENPDGQFEDKLCTIVEQI